MLSSKNTQMLRLFNRINQAQKPFISGASVNARPQIFATSAPQRYFSAEVMSAEKTEEKSEVDIASENARLGIDTVFSE